MGVALVASAAVKLAQGSCKDNTTRVIAAVAVVAVVMYPATWVFPLLIVFGERLYSSVKMPL